MGLIADFFVASGDDALAYEASYISNRAAHTEKYEPAEFRNLTGVEIGILWAHLVGEKWSVDKHMLTEIRFGDGGETWLLQVPNDLVQLLASLKDDDLAPLAEWWATTEEFQLRGADDVDELLSALHALAKKAKSSGEGLFLWGSL